MNEEHMNTVFIFKVFYHNLTFSKLK